MRIRRSLLVLFILMLGLPVLVSAQGAENLVTKAAASVTVGRNLLPDEHLRMVENDVTYVGRHCQDYMVKHNVLARLFLGRKNGIDANACASDPSTIFYQKTVHNLRTTAGGDWQASVMGNTSAPPATCNYIALSNDAGAPSAGDTSVASEIASNGLSRAQGTYAHTGGTASYTVQKVFTATGTQASQKAGLLNAGTSGTLCFENTYTQVTVNNGDTLTVTWTINY